jgi:hypothetical protein
MPQTNNLPLPNFLIVGAQRSGTTSLHYYLTQHKDVLLPDTKKEVNFFTNQPFSKKSIDDYRQYFGHWCGERAVGEASPTYMFTSYVPKLIASQLPNVKILCILRDPVARSYSHYCYSLKRKLEWLPFNQAIAQEDQRVKKLWETTGRESWYYAYKYLSDYELHLKRFMEYFPRDQIFVTTFEKLVNTPDDALREICQFINVDENFQFQKITKDNIRTNFGQYPSFPQLYRSLVYIQRNWSQIPGLWRLSNLSKSLLPKLPLINLLPEPDLKSCMELKRFFTPKVQEIQKNFNVDFSKWNLAI